MFHCKRILPKDWTLRSIFYCRDREQAYGLRKRLEFNVFVPTGAPMVLQAYIARFWMVAISNIELMRRAIGTFVGLGELCEIDRVDLFIVEHDFNLRISAGDFDVIPFSH